MSEVHKLVAEALVTPAHDELGSPQDWLASVGGVVGGIAGSYVAHEISTSQPASVGNSERPVDSTPEAEMLFGGLVGVALGAYVTYRGIRRFAVNQLGEVGYRLAKGDQ